MTCGHTLRKVSFRRFLVGEKLRCRLCERAAATQPVLNGMYPAVTE